MPSLLHVGHRAPRTSRRGLWLAGTIGLAVTASAIVSGHDFWMEPSTFRPTVGAALSIELRVGEHFAGQPVVRDSRSIDRFVVLGPAGEIAIPGADGTHPAGVLRVSAPGLYILGYRSRPASIELPPAAFETYLKEEGLEHVIEARRKRGQSMSGGHEIFSRCAKAIVVTAGSGVAAGQDRPLGFRLELIPEREVSPIGANPRTSLRLLYENAPLAGALVSAIAHGDPLKRVTGRTDKGGRVALPLGEGPWLVKAVHMVPAPAATGAEWESLWASLTFER